MLLARFQTAVVALALILVVLFVLPPSAVVPVIFLVVLGGAWEWTALVRIENTLARLGYVAIIAAGCIAMWLSPAASYTWPMLALAAAWWLIAFALVVRYPLPVPRWLTFVGGPLTLWPAFLALSALIRYPQTGSITGPTLLLFVLVVIWGADVGAYFAGRAFGRSKLAPLVSPNKTWAGVFGGLAAAATIGFAGSAYFGLAWFRLVPLCLATAAVSVVGDLLVSLFKREAGLKDSGVLFPGHGGVLDRIDSISAGTPLFVAGIVMGHGAW